MNKVKRNYIKIICRELYGVRVNIRTARENGDTKRLLHFLHQKVDLRRELEMLLQPAAEPQP